MRFISILYICLGVLLMTPCFLKAQTFKADHLQRAYEKLKLGSNPLIKQGLSIRTDEEGRIEHLGISLFNEEMRTLLPSPIYDYLEYALLNHQYQVSENTLQEQKIRFRNGSWDDLARISPKNDCVIENRDDKWYIVTWERPSNEPLSVLIPIDYELLANSSRKEMELNFARDLKRFKPAQPKPYIVEADELQSLHRDGLLVMKGQSFLIPEINSDTYFKLEIVKEEGKTMINDNKNKVVDVTFEEELPFLLQSCKYPRETLANILLTPHHADTNVSLSLELLYAGYHKESVSVCLTQWMGYCQSQGCLPYYIYERTNDNEGSAILLMHNRSEGYAHLAYLHCDISQLEAKKQNYTGKVYMYIPTSNIKELFAKVASGKSTPKIYE